MPVEPKIDDLLSRWEELVEEGKSPTAAELCRDTPILQPRLENRIQALEAMNRFLGKTDATIAWNNEPTPLPTALRIPMLPGYEMLGELRRGGMGIVYEARHLRLDRVVAVKMIRHHFDEATARRFYAEARTLAHLQHPHIVQVYDVGEHDGQLYFAMELMAGGNLSQRMQQYRYSPTEAAELLKMLALTIQVAHDQNIIHRDLKPSNILLAVDGTPKIADFGLAKDLSAGADATRTGEIMGTPGYMAPEQASGRRHEVGPAADIYALGATLYELLCGRPPFDGEQALYRAPDQEPVPPSRWRSGIPRRLEAICLHCLRPRPENRYPTARSLADDLDAYLSGGAVRARPRGWSGAFRQLLRRRFWTILAAVSLCAVALLAAQQLWQHFSTQTGPKTAEDQEALQAAAAVEEMQRQLRAGKSVFPLNDEGKPRWSNWRGTPGGVTALPKEQGFTLNAFALSLLELLPAPQTDRFRFQAMIRHEGASPGDCPVGIFFGGVPYPDAAGKMFCCWTLTFSDMRDWSAQNVPKEYNGNPLSFDIRSFGTDAAGKFTNLNAGGGSLLFFQPALKTGDKNPWRKIKVEVTRELITVYWDDTKVHKQPTKTMQAYHKEFIVRKLPGLDPAFVDDSLRGSLGVFLHESVASFKDIQIEPLPAPPG
jgi:serine/threonine-protein kinase